jgi:hypothetical protein
MKNKIVENKKKKKDKLFNDVIYNSTLSTEQLNELCKHVNKENKSWQKKKNLL